MNIEKLAIEAGLYVEGGEIRVFPKRYNSISNLDISNTLEAFAKALQSSEPVATVEVGSNDFGPFVFEETAYGADHLTDGKHDLFTHPPASVPLEKYNKLLDAHKQIGDIELANRLGGNTRTEYHANSNKAYRMQNISLQAIAEAEAEGKEG